MKLYYAHLHHTSKLVRFFGSPVPLKGNETETVLMDGMRTNAYTLDPTRCTFEQVASLAKHIEEGIGTPIMDTLFDIEDNGIAIPEEYVTEIEEREEPTA